jgi:hypothetical protein
MTLPGIDSASDWEADSWANAEPLVDPETEIPAESAREIAANIAAATHTQIRAIVQFDGVTYTSGSMEIAVAAHEEVWGSATNSPPTIVQTAAGRYKVTWPTTVVDELAESHTLGVRYPYPPGVSGAVVGRGYVVDYTANTITIQTVDGSFANNSLNGDTINVFWG